LTADVATSCPCVTRAYDGRTVVDTGSERESPLYRVNSAGLTKLVERDAGGATITPDGKVLFAGLGTERFVIPLEGGAPQPLHGPGTGTPAVSPDGKRFAFGTDKPDVVVLCEVPACVNATEVKVSYDPETSQWAPDGRGIASSTVQTVGTSGRGRSMAARRMR
jgi:hypothetical protein